jgi:Fe-S cluster assembly protein SufD
MKHDTICQDLLVAAARKFPADGLRALRERALERFAATGLPDMSTEDWRYTNLQPAVELSNDWLANITEAAVPAEDAAFPTQEFERAIDARWLRFLNGRLAGIAATEAAESRIQVSALSADSGDGASILNIIDGISSFNAALMHDAVVIRVPAGMSGTRPIALMLANDASEATSVSASRVVFEVGRNASIDVIENHLSLAGTRSFANVVIEMKLEEGARVNLLRLQDCSDTQILAGKLIVTLGQDATFDYTSVDLGGALVRNDVTVSMPSPGAAVCAGGLYLASGSQHIDNHIRVDHRAGPSRSRCEFRGILHGRARCVFNSKAIVHAGADGTDAEQSNHNLLLSDHAEIDTKPELEIYADEVKCAHGATVGQLDKTAMFYLRSRGIDADSASRMLTRAFAASILAGLSVPAAADYLAGKVDRRLDTLVGGVT